MATRLAERDVVIPRCRRSSAFWSSHEPEKKKSVTFCLASRLIRAGCKSIYLFEVNFGRARTVINSGPGTPGADRIVG